MEQLTVKELGFTYAAGTALALRGVSFSLRAGELVVVCGKSGCGKSTLLRSLKPQLAPVGERTGEILLDGRELSSLPEAETAADIGFVMQNPDAQLVTDRVWHELAFGLENLGLPADVIRSRVAETANYFGIHTWFRKRTDELSGGQKQLLNLASVMLMRPRLLILDEPSSQLDPIASRDFLENVRRINRELGTTVLITEHNLEDIYAYADRVLLIEDGAVRALLPPREMALFLAGHDPGGMYKALPTPARIGAAAKEGDCPLSIVEGREWFSSFAARRALTPPAEEPFAPRPERQALGMEEVWFQYKKGAEPVLRNLDLDVRYGEIYALLGGNGAGKTTALSLLTGERKTALGRVTVAGKPLASYRGNSLFDHNLAALPQNPQALFVGETLEEDLLGALEGMGAPKEERPSRAEEIAKRFSLTQLLSRHPYDLSGGELQKAALAKLLLREPKILLLDEPTKGMDALAKEAMGGILKSLSREGACVLLVTHDIEFCARVADRCAMFFDGAIACEGTPHRFFGQNSYYTTAASRMTRHVLPGVITCQEGERLCRP